MYGKPCDQCGEYAQLTHKIKSDVMDIQVCYPCGVHAELLQSDCKFGPGQMTITLFERPKVIPLFFECSICHGRFTAEQGYADHWHKKHA